MKNRYRAEIDGLRALAVLPVVLYHAQFPGFSGGFVGVDVFFVISGFLITGILLSDMEAGTYSVSGFYERRIRRIMPSLLVVLLFVVVAAPLPFYPASFHNLAVICWVPFYSSPISCSGLIRDISLPGPKLNYCCTLGRSG